MKYRIAVLGIALFALGATGCKQANTPTQPNTPAPQPAPGPVTYNIAVSVQTLRGGGVAGATIEILDGQFAGQTFTVGADGTTTLTGAQGNMNLEARSAGCASVRGGVGPPATSGATQSVTFTLQTPGGSPWTRSGSGDNVLDMPRCVDRVRIQGSFGGSCQNFVVEVDGDLLVNEILGTCSVAIGPNFEGTFATTGGQAEVRISAGVSWTFTEIRP